MAHLSSGPFWRFVVAGRRSAELGATTVLLATPKHLARLHHLRRRLRSHRYFASGELRNGSPRRGSGCIHHRLFSDQSRAQLNLVDSSAKENPPQLIICRRHFARGHTSCFCARIGNDFCSDSLCLTLLAELCQHCDLGTRSRSDSGQAFNRDALGAREVSPTAALAPLAGRFRPARPVRPWRLASRALSRSKRPFVRRAAFWPAVTR